MSFSRAGHLTEDTNLGPLFRKFYYPTTDFTTGSIISCGLENEPALLEVDWTRESGGENQSYLFKPSSVRLYCETLLRKTQRKKKKYLPSLSILDTSAIYSSLCHHNRNHYLIVVLTLVCRLSLTMWTKWSVARILSAPFRTSTAIFLYTWWICWRSWVITLQLTVNIRCWISLPGLITMDITLLNSRKRPLKVRLLIFLITLVLGWEVNKSACERN